MKRNTIIKTFSPDKTEITKLTAFHEAGHAAGIHLNNTARRLLPVPFKIVFKEMSYATEAGTQVFQRYHNDYYASVEGGRLIESLPPPINGQVCELAGRKGTILQWEKDYRKKLEADIVNLLIGPLAEAKYVADTDDELFNHKLVNLQALNNYGGNSDISLVDQYIRYLSPDKQRRFEILDELFMEAFNFVENDENWAAITQLADYILDSNKHTLDYEEVVSVLDQAVAHFQYQMSFVAKYHYWGWHSEI